MPPYLTPLKGSQRGATNGGGEGREGEGGMERKDGEMEMKLREENGMECKERLEEREG